MSRIGKRAITIPSGTEVSVDDGMITVKGKIGTLSRTIHSSISIVSDGKEITVSPRDKTRIAQALWGTYAAHVRNMIEGVHTPFKKNLQVEGIGFKAEVQGGKTLKMALGFSHPVLVEIPEGIVVTVEKNIINVSGADKDAVGQFSASVRSLKKPEPYKGKGIRYVDEKVRSKQGKKAAGSA